MNAILARADEAASCHGRQGSDVPVEQLKRNDRNGIAAR